jgi:hypothetical protein
VRRYECLVRRGVVGCGETGGRRSRPFAVLRVNRDASGTFTFGGPSVRVACGLNCGRRMPAGTPALLLGLLRGVGIRLGLVGDWAWLVAFRL